MTDSDVKLFVFDLDGTALGGHEPYARFPRPFARLLDDLDRRGVRWATNTTWSVENQFHLVADSGLRSRPAVLTGSTGRAMATIRGGRLCIDRRHERRVLARDRRFRRKHAPAVREALGRLLAEDLIDRLALNRFEQNMITFGCRRGCRKRAWEVVEPLLRSRAYHPWDPHRPASGTLLPDYMNKGEALRVIQRRVKVGPGETIVAGDARNDRHMLDPSLARWLVCPANAAEEVKARVRAAGGIVARRRYSWGLVEAVRRILAGKA